MFCADLIWNVAHPRQDSGFRRARATPSSSTPVPLKHLTHQPSSSPSFLRPARILAILSRPLFPFEHPLSVNLATPACPIVRLLEQTISPGSNVTRSLTTAWPTDCQQPILTVNSHENDNSFTWSDVESSPESTQFAAQLVGWQYHHLRCDLILRARTASEENTHFVGLTCMTLFEHSSS